MIWYGKKNNKGKDIQQAVHTNYVIIKKSPVLIGPGLIRDNQLHYNLNTPHNSVPNPDTWF